MSEKVSMETGISAASQESAFMNATLQDLPNNLTISIATYLEVPTHVAALGEEATDTYIDRMLEKAAASIPGLTFDVQLGPTKESLPEWKDDE